VLLPHRFNLYLSTPRPVADQMFAFAEHLRGAVRELTDLLAPPSPPALSKGGFWRRLLGRR
jgi:hypothetical protein